MLSRSFSYQISVPRGWLKGIVNCTLIRDAYISPCLSTIRHYSDYFFVIAFPQSLTLSP